MKKSRFFVAVAIGIAVGAVHAHSQFEDAPLPRPCDTNRTTDCVQQKPPTSDSQKSAEITERGSLCAGSHLQACVMVENARRHATEKADILNLKLRNCRNGSYLCQADIAHARSEAERAAAQREQLEAEFKDWAQGDCPDRCKSLEDAVTYCRANPSAKVSLSANDDPMSGYLAHEWCPTWLANQKEGYLGITASDKQAFQMQINDYEHARRDAERKQLETERAADRASASKHTTRYEGLYVGEFSDNAPLTQSRCNSYDAHLQTALEKIGTGKSVTECLVLLDRSGRIEKIVLFTRTPFLQKYHDLVAQYGNSLPGRYAELSQDSPDCCNLWRTNDGTVIWERPAQLTMRGTPENAYLQTVVPYTIVVFERK